MIIYINTDEKIIEVDNLVDGELKSVPVNFISKICDIPGVDGSDHYSISINQGLAKYYRKVYAENNFGE